ncbi:MAG TPA: cation transporter [Porticoccus sp.]|nr:cation transporter [Porticoccus sp.]
MHRDNIQHWHHDHTFAQDQRRPGESRTLIVIAITAVMMAVELFAGIKFGSMALLADGLHMASHTVALSITAFAYVYARRNARNSLYSFGTGKVNALGGFTGAVLLAIFALFMGVESVGRLLNPVEIIFNQAIFVALLGLLVNGACVFILGVEGHDHDHAHPHHHDHNLKSAYLHVMADALTSVLAIVALLTAKYFGLIWMDPAMGIVGALLVARWSYGLLGSTSTVLLDRQASEKLREKIREVAEADGDTRVTDLHVWSIGPEIYSAQISVVANNPATPIEYKARIPAAFGLVHISIEIHKYSDLEYTA